MKGQAANLVKGDRLSDFTQDRRILMLALMALAIGAFSAVVAAALVKLIALATNLAFFHRVSFADASPAGHTLGVFVVFIPMAGGLLIGLMARFGSEKIRGHGIPEALEAILIGRSRMDPKVAALKPLSSAISIGTGGPFGAEGPIIMTGGAVGSLFAQFFHLSAAERKTLLVAGAAGGMAAVFAAPVAAVLLAVELLLFEWRPRSFIPVALSASVAGLLRIPLMGSGPIFPIPIHAPPAATAIGFAFLVGIVSGLGSMVLTSLVYLCEDLFHKLPVHWMWWPVAGGLVVGIGGWIDPRVFGVGYDSIHGLLLGQDLGGGLVWMLIIKAIIWSVALGSGTSGGVLAPLLIMGGALGSLEGHLIPFHDPGFWALIGMASMMGGTMRSPLTAMIFAVELTHDISALPALLAGCAAAHAVTVLFMRRSILTEKVARRGHHLTREYSVDPLQLVRVGEIMSLHVASIPAHMTVAELSGLLASPNHELNHHQAVFIVDERDKLAGIITRKDILRSLRGDSEGEETVLEGGSAELVTIHPDELLDDAVTKMLWYGVGRLPVVSREEPGRLVGYLGRSAILAARAQRLSEENVREPGWGIPFRGSSPGLKS
ncbi:MAG: Chloride channel core [Fibrobacteres bacterium]|nr:Chloride channel core [Fibrobacterota bacterium]